MIPFSGPILYPYSDFWEVTFANDSSTWTSVQVQKFILNPGATKGKSIYNAQHL